MDHLEGPKYPEKPFGCSFPGCSKRFSRKDCLQLHYKTHTGEKSYVCDILVKNCGCETECHHEAESRCGKSFISSSHLNRHKKSHRNPFVHVCPICQVKFKKKTKLRQHSLDYHNIAEFLCEEDGCGRHFSSKAKLILHQQTHGRLMCPVINCSAVFTSQSLLEDHVAKHDSNAVLVKTRSRKNSKIKGNSFSSIHNEDCDHPCSGIEDEVWIDAYLGSGKIEQFGFSNGEEDEDDDNDDDVLFISHEKSNKKKRKSRKHDSSSSKKSKTEKEIFRCPHNNCERVFSQNKNLEAHVKAVHSTTKPYPCPDPFCGKAFGFKSVLERHMLRWHGSVTSSTGAASEKPRDDAKNEIDQFKWNNLLGLNCSTSSEV